MTITTPQPRPPAPRPVQNGGWSAGRLVALALGLFLLLGSAGSLVAAGVLSQVDDELRDGAYLTADERSLGTDSHALAVEEIDLDGLSVDWLLGRARIRVTGTDPQTSVFVGIARADDVEDYLGTFAHTVVDDIDHRDVTYVEHPGAAPGGTPADADIWVAQASGPGTQTVTWTPRDGNWTAVVMNADASGGVDVQTDVGATVPVLEWTSCGLWIAGGVAGLLGGLLVAGAPRRRRA